MNEAENDKLEKVKDDWIPLSKCRIYINNINIELFKVLRNNNDKFYGSGGTSVMYSLNTFHYVGHEEYTGTIKLSMCNQIKPGNTELITSATVMIKAADNVSKGEMLYDIITFLFTTVKDVKGGEIFLFNEEEKFQIPENHYSTEELDRVFL